mgnify:CR=1 FL=1
MSENVIDLLPNLYVFACIILLGATSASAQDASPHKEREVGSSEDDSSMSSQQNSRRRHPFLICTREQFPELRARAEHEPWASMKHNALERADHMPGSGESRKNLWKWQRFLGACALAYIVEPERADQHGGRIHEGIVTGLANLEFNEDLKWRGVVPAMGVAFTSIIALDIAHADLTAEEIEACESVIENQIAKIDRRGAWPLARYGTHGTWDIYTGKRSEPDDAYHRDLMKQITDDGVMTTATNYAWARLASGDGRLQKTGYIDVLEFTGIDRRYYKNPRLKRFYQWLYGYSITPARQLHAFGDFIPGDAKNTALAYRAGRFDDLAGRYMAWALEGRRPPGHVLAYVPKKKSSEPKVPTSRLFPNGGAFLREPEDSPDSLGAALYNIESPAMWHAHQEANAVSLSAYGTRLLMNGGWLGPATRPAKLNNTLTLDGQDHDTRSGAGLDEGLTANGLDYAAGLSGDALPADASFIRSLIMVHSQDAAGGYFLILDDVRAESGRTAHQYLHPSTDARPETLRESAEYDARVNLFNEVQSTQVSFFYATRPDQVEISSVPSGSDRAGREDHYRLDAAYPVGEDGRARPCTVIFPHDDQHPEASFRRVETSGARGVDISQDADPVDHLFLSSGKRQCRTADDVQFRGRAVLFRTSDGAFPFYFVRKGTRFHGGEKGFSSDQPVSLHVRGNTGRISTSGKTRITFHHPNITEIRLMGEPLPAEKTGPDQLTVVIPAGNNQRIEFPH